MLFRVLASFLAVIFLAGCDSVSKISEASAVPETAVEPAAKLLAVSLPETVSFNEHIQPVLSEYCYHCHGPDSGTREPKSEPLRLDRVEDAFALRENGRPVIIKGSPGESKIYQLMISDDPEAVMPPPHSHKTMNAEEIALIKRWIEQGAEYEPHWAFTPVKKPDLPEAGATWAANPIDRFIAEKLDESGLEPNPPEDLRRFYRRLHLDLTGLPPAPESVDAFLENAGTGLQAAIEKAADELLATTASAEHFARHWLDAARYADTHGIHIDNYRAIWPYRDWVIRAFKDNMPWDRFTTEQLAGDMLPDRTLDQLVATGFSRCLATTGEGGAINEEYDAIYAQDRVETVSAIWLGLTTGCAACHDHKFDPVSIQEFYSLAAFFRNTTMNAMDGNNAEHPPNVFVPLPEDRDEWKQLTEKIETAEKDLAARAEAAKPDFEKWQLEPVFHFNRSMDPALSVELAFNEPDGPLRGFVDKQPREWAVDVKRVEGPFGMAPVISDVPIDLGDIASFSRGDQVTLGGYFRMEGQTTGTLIGCVDPTANQRGWELALDDGSPVFLVCDSWDKAATKIEAKKKLQTGKWHHLMVTFDGKLGSHQVASIFIDGQRVQAGPDPNTVGGNIESKVPLRLGARHGENPKFNARVAMQDFRFYRRLLSASEIAELPEKIRFTRIASTPVDQRTKEQTDLLRRYFFTNVDSPSLEILKNRNELETQRKVLRDRGSVSLVMEEKKEEPFAHVLNRGVYSDPGEKVTPNTPAVLPPMPEGAPKNRLGLAQWLNDPANPLPARVTMNRTWYYFFGTGIVESNDDFGIMGARPSHPKLLDWLAAEFVDSKWNYRHMLKLMVSSATYRQSGKVTPEKLEKDPDNRLLARGPRIRLDAEPIRDLALAASGLLSNKTGGPPVKPYQPEGIWEAVAMPQSNTRHYKQDSGDSLYRRSLYTLWKRTAAPATMEIFNAPTRETFCVRRDLTNTPLQALALMNDPQFVEASRELATLAIRASSDTDSRIDFITLRLTARTLDHEERKMLTDSLIALGEVFHDSPEDADKLIRTGEKPPADDIKAPELAAWTLIASQILNLDETITR
jgi:hypothetical protein